MKNKCARGETNDRYEIKISIIISIGMREEVRGTSDRTRDDLVVIKNQNGGNLHFFRLQYFNRYSTFITFKTHTFTKNDAENPRRRVLALKLLVGGSSFER